MAALSLDPHHPPWLASGALPLALACHFNRGVYVDRRKRFGPDGMKGAGMRWTVHGAKSVATLWVFVLS